MYIDYLCYYLLSTSSAPTLKQEAVGKDLVIHKNKYVLLIESTFDLFPMIGSRYHTLPRREPQISPYNIFVACMLFISHGNGRTLSVVLNIMARNLKESFFVFTSSSH